MSGRMAQTMALLRQRTQDRLARRPSGGAFTPSAVSAAASRKVVSLPSGPPEARPVPPVSDLMGRQPVRVAAEGTDLVAYGFGGQRIAIPVTSIASVVAHPGYKGRFRSPGPALVVLDARERALLRAAGTWGEYPWLDRWGRPVTDLKAVCDSLTLPPPEFLSRYSARSRRPGRRRAPGYRRLRTRPRGFALWVLALCLLIPTVLGLGIFAGTLPAVALPSAIGSVRVLIGIAGGVLGGVAGLWLLGHALAAAAGTIRWAVFSLRAHSPAPPARFFERDKRPGTARKLATAGMVLLVPALVGWGPGVGIVTLVHGFSDQALVTLLRQHGVPTLGLVVDEPSWTTDSSGDVVIHHHPTLAFYGGGLGKTVTRAPDPAIGGRTWPINEKKLLIVVYDPADPQRAAVQQQIEGSPWHGAPTGNLVACSILTAGLPVLVWLVVRRIRGMRRAGREEMLEGIW